MGCHVMWSTGPHESEIVRVDWDGRGKAYLSSCGGSVVDIDKIQSHVVHNSSLDVSHGQHGHA